MKEPGLDIEQIDAYLLGQFTEADKVQFEQAMRKDPSLQKEVSIQKEVIDAIQAHRKAELKARLNAIKVSTSPFRFTKAAAAISLVLLIGATSYFIFSDKSKQQETISTEPVNTTKTAEKETPVKTIIPVEKPASPVNTPGKVAKVERPAIEKAEKITKPTTKPVEVENTVPVPLPDINDNLSTGETIGKGIALPDDGLSATSTETKNKNLDIKLAEKKGTPLYQYYESKLFLYGNFKSNPYEVMEFNAQGKKELYLYFSGEFYQLKVNTFDKTPLEKLEDPQIKERLEAMKQK